MRRAAVAAGSVTESRSPTRFSSVDACLAGRRFPSRRGGRVETGFPHKEGGCTQKPGFPNRFIRQCAPGARQGSRAAERLSVGAGLGHGAVAAPGVEHAPMANVSRSSL